MYIFNLNYKFRHDGNRLVLIDDYRKGGQEFKSFVHPVYAWIISLFDGMTTVEEVTDRISGTLGISPAQAEDVIRPLLENDKDLHIRYGGVLSSLPEYIITENRQGVRRERPDDTFFTSVTEPDHTSWRLNRPMSLLLCPTLRCYTNCTYCYADRKHPHVEFDGGRWAELVYHAKEQDIDRIDVTGGEFFMLKGWQKVARALVDCGYTPEISTKIPLTGDTLDDILASGLGCVQFSLDTLDAGLAVDTLKVGTSYVDSLLESIRYADSIGLDVILKPTLSRTTCTPDNVREIILFADTLQHIRRVVVSTIGFSCYKPRTHYADIRPTMQQIENLRSFLSHMQDGRDYPVIDDSFTYRPHEMQSGTAFDDRPACTANLDGFVILPDGTATICEELYFHPDFIIGNCFGSTIPEVWQSEKAVRLFHLQKENVPAESACAACSTLELCRSRKGICWKLVLAAYGMDKPFHPDPRCPQAPQTDGAFLIP